MMHNYTYCDLEDFRRNYKENVHGYLSLTVCIFGSVANLLNLCVLRKMRSPTNCILMGLALADLLVMIQYIPFTIHRSLPPNPLYYTHFNQCWAYYYKFHAHFSLVLHFIACCLTIILAIWRYVYVSQIHAGKICSNQRKTALVILGTYVVCPLVCIPMYSTLEIREYQQTCDLDGVIVLKHERSRHRETDLKNETIYLLYPNDPNYLSVWVYGIFLKLIPCVLLSCLFYKIIAALVDTRRRRIRLLNSSSPMQELSSNKKSKSLHLYKENQADRTTRMLLAVLFLFLLTEFPQAILSLVSALYGEVFLNECYSALGEVMDVMALINSAINFILYCSMSRQFRVTFQEVLRIKDISCWIRQNVQSPATHVHTGEENGAETKMSLV